MLIANDGWYCIQCSYITLLYYSRIKHELYENREREQNEFHFLFHLAIEEKYPAQFHLGLGVCSVLLAAVLCLCGVCARIINNKQQTCKYISVAMSVDEKKKYLIYVWSWIFGTLVFVHQRHAKKKSIANFDIITVLNLSNYIEPRGEGRQRLIVNRMGWLGCLYVRAVDATFFYIHCEADSRLQLNLIISRMIFPIFVLKWHGLRGFLCLISNRTANTIQWGKKTKKIDIKFIRQSN